MSNLNYNTTGLQIFNLSRNIGCCLQCSLRFCRIILTEESIQLTNLLSKVKILESNVSQLDLHPCVVCLGILQNNISKSFINNTANKIKKLNYDRRAISFTFSFPIAIRIRERAVHIYLSEKVHQLNELWNRNRLQNIKDIYKTYISQEMKHLLNESVEIDENQMPLTIEVILSYSEDQEECIKLLTNYENLADNAKLRTNIKKNITKKTIDIVMNSITDKQFTDYFIIPPKRPSQFVNIDKIIFKQENIFIGGRYVKLSRRLCQTPWLVDGKHKMDTSVQELICNHIMDYANAESTKFLSSGREDVDVRMLLLGRPFAVELINPKIGYILNDDFLHLKNKINNSTKKVKITKNFKILTKSDLKKLKEGEYSKTKSYRALCLCKRFVDRSFILKKLQTIHNLEIIQNTPIRVLHRRTLSPRKRIIYEIRARYPNLEELKCYRKKMKCISQEETFIILDLKTQAGTYVKEFVHGDFGRTMPNLCYLLNTEIDILALDVTNIALEWP